MTSGTRNWSIPAVTNDTTYGNGGEKKRPQGGRMARSYKTFCIESKDLRLTPKERRELEEILKRTTLLVGKQRIRLTLLEYENF
jgi:hypothetical protein